MFQSGTTPRVERELSWLSFNERVLQEAGDPNVPLIERVRFLGIYSNNQDEFFRVRMPDVRRRIAMHEDKSERRKKEQRLLADLQVRLTSLSERFEAIYTDVIRSLARSGVFLVNEDQLREDQKEWVLAYFRQHILSHVAPFFLGPDHHMRMDLADNEGYLFVRLTRDKQHRYALIRLPTDRVARFIELPRGKGLRQRTLILLDNVIRLGMHEIFGSVIRTEKAEAWAMKLTRDAEYDLVDEIEMSLVERMDSALDQRLTAAPSRLVYDREIPDEALAALKLAVGVDEDQYLAPGGRYHNFKDFMSFPTQLGRKSFLNKPLPAIDNPRFAVSRSVFKAIRQRDILVYYPYHRFEHFTELLRQAAYDLKVRSIQISLYRVASDSMVIKNLIDAARNGKNVHVVLELQARFDEQNNLEWARVLTDAGVKVSFGINQLKVHAKICRIVREEKKEKRQYCYIGTGNFHEKTARIYTDFGLFTANAELCDEVEQVFQFIEAPYKRFRYRYLWVSPRTQRRELYQRMDREIAVAKKGGFARIRAKINNLVDDGLVEKLYEASQAGVSVQLIIRGMCALVPGVKGLSDNIKIISVVDRFLEHPRLVEFENSGTPEVYISSADWMTRNLDRRVEVAAPILDPELAQRVMHLFEIQWADRAKARQIDAQQTNQYVPRGNRKKLRSQHRIYDVVAKWDRGIEEV